MPMPKVTRMNIDDLDKWLETKPEIGDIAYGVDVRTGKEYLYCHLGKDIKPVWMPIDLFVINKKQYTVHRSGAHCSVAKYYNGSPEGDKKFFWCDDEVDEYTEQLRKEGYEIAFTDNQVQEAQEEYDYVMSHRLIKRGELK